MKYLYYTIKPAIPRPMQIFFRRQMAWFKRRKYAHLWPIDPHAGSPPAGWSGWPEGNDFALVLSHDVDSRHGYDQCLKLADLEEELGFRSSFNFVPERYGKVELSLIKELQRRGFGIGVHGLKHDGKLYFSKRIFDQRAVRINGYLRQWQTRGFTSPSMHHNLDWLAALNIDYSISTFDTDPFEPQPDAAGTIFPFWYANSTPSRGFVELPYTLPQDSTLFIILQEPTIDIWRRKLSWVVEKGGMALLNTHPDYMRFDTGECGPEEYPAAHYRDFLLHVKEVYGGRFWAATAAKVAGFWKSEVAQISARVESDSRIEVLNPLLESRVIIIDPETDSRWDKFVEEHPYGWVCHLSGWKRVLESSFPHMKGYYFALFDEAGEKIEAGLPVFHVRSWLLGDRLVSIPFATLCDPLVSDQAQFRTLFQEVEKLAKSMDCLRIEIRSLYSAASLEKCGLNEDKSYKLHYLKLEKSPDELWKQLHPKSVRHSIRRAQKSGLCLNDGGSDEGIGLFYGLHRQTRRRIGLPLHPRPFFVSLRREFGGSGLLQVLLAKKESDAIGALLVFKYKDRVSTDYSAYDAGYRDLMPNHFLFWEGMKLAKREGFGVFDFGRTHCRNRKLMDFKARWGTSVADLPQYFCPANGADVLSSEEGSVKHKMITKACKFAPNFAQETIGNFCYRHLG